MGGGEEIIVVKRRRTCANGLALSSSREGAMRTFTAQLEGRLFRTLHMHMSCSRQSMDPFLCHVRRVRSHGRTAVVLHGPTQGKWDSSTIGFSDGFDAVLRSYVRGGLEC